MLNGRLQETGIGEFVAVIKEMFEGILVTQALHGPLPEGAYVVLTVNVEVPQHGAGA